MTDELTPPAAPPPTPPARPASSTPSTTAAGPSIWIIVAGVAGLAIVLALLFRAFVNPVPVAVPSPSPTAAPTAKASPSQSPPPSPSTSPSPTPSASAEATASPSAAPTAGPTAGPTATPAPTGTPGPTAGPSASPRPSPTPIPVPTTSCIQPDTGVTVVYPKNWFTIDEPPQYACAFFDSSPIVIPPDQTFPDAPVAVLADETPYQEALTAMTDPLKWKVISQSTTKVSGLPATVAEVAWIGRAPYTVGTMRYFYLVDRGGQGSVLFVTQGQASDTYATDKQVLGLMASKSTISAPQ